ncbi:ester cyclase [Yoonia sp. R2331]|uniref:ester cyclase n=1 Tax=Yoonia sp. R2331 TaxID=3237238 RepID=UPI0034E4F8F0
MRDWDRPGVGAALRDLLAPDAVVHLCHPFGDLTGPDAWLKQAYTPLAQSMPDLERCDAIVMSGPDDAGAQWIGCAGHYIGTFLYPFIDIPPTGHLAHLRYHEFYRLDGDTVTEVQAIWDIPDLMMQANAWPMVPPMGRHLCVPGPATQDGLRRGPRDTAESAASLDHVLAMLAAMGRHPSEPPEAMELPRFWDARMMWYGPAAIGTARGIAGFRHWHQMPFLSAMPDRGKYRDTLGYHFFADGPYVAVTGWPNMKQTLTDDGWLGIAPAGKQVTLCSLDFWRIADGKIRENWVMLDLLDLYRQLGVDVLARMRAMNAARATGPAAIAKEYA